MKKEDVEKIVSIINEHLPKIHIDALVKYTGIQKRRLYDVLPILEVLGYITRDKGIITKVEPMKEEEHNGKYSCHKVAIHANGAILSVKQLGPQGVLIEQTANEFQVEVIE